MPGNIHSPTPKLKEGTFVLDPNFVESCHTPTRWNFKKTRSGINGGSRGRARGAHPPSLLDQNEALRAEKIFLPPAPYLKVWICHWGFQ